MWFFNSTQENLVIGSSIISVIIANLILLRAPRHIQVKFRLSIFMAILIALSAGYQMTRLVLAGHPNVAWVFTVFFLISSVLYITAAGVFAYNAYNASSQVPPAV